MFNLRKISMYSVLYSISIFMHVYLSVKSVFRFGRLSFPIIFSYYSQIRIIKKYYIFDWVLRFWIENQKLISFQHSKIFEFFSFYFLLVSHHQFYSNYSNFLTFTQNFIFSFSISCTKFIGYI